MRKLLLKLLGIDKEIEELRELKKELSRKLRETEVLLGELQEFAQVSDRVNELEDEVNDLDRRIDDVADSVEELENRVEGIEGCDCSELEEKIEILADDVARIASYCNLT